jgi:hypothetical protein
MSELAANPAASPECQCHVLRDIGQGDRQVECHLIGDIGFLVQTSRGSGL